MRSISCQADMHNKVRPPSVIGGAVQPVVDKKATKTRPRSQSVRGPKSKEKEKDREKPVVNENEDTLKRTMSVRYKNDKTKAIKDINLKTSNINQDKEKGVYFETTRI